MFAQQNPFARWLALALLVLPGTSWANEAAIMSTLEDGTQGIFLPTPLQNLPNPTQQAVALPNDAQPHGLAFRLDREMLFADFAQAKLYRRGIGGSSLSETVSLNGFRNSANGTLAVDPSGRYALSIGESSNGTFGESVVVDLSMQPPQVSTIAAGLQVKQFVTAAIDFHRDGRAFVCHRSGVSVLSAPYTSIDFTMAFPQLLQSGSQCRLSPDGSRLFVTRVLSESVPTVNGVRTSAAPFSASSVFIDLPAPADVQGLGPLVVSPDGQAIIVAQQFLFPPLFAGVKARAWLLRAPFNGSTFYQELSLPASVVGNNCLDGNQTIDCAGFEHAEVNANATLLILTGNSSSITAGASDSVPAVFIRSPFNDALRSAQAVQIGTGAGTLGRGAGGVRFLPSVVFRNGFE